MTTVDRDRDNDGRCHTVGAGPLLTSEQVYGDCRMSQYAGVEIGDTTAATIASWWHGPRGRGQVFSMLSHRIAGGVGVVELLDAVHDALATLDANVDQRPADEVQKDRQALEMLSTWAMNGPPPPWGMAY